jgi:hypothetical protein
MMALGYMSPCSAQRDLGDCRWCDLEAFGDGCRSVASHAHSANSHHLFIGQFCQSLSRAVGAIAASLAEHVLHVLNVRSREKALGITAPSVITMVADFCTIWHGTISQLPCNSASDINFSFVVDAPVATGWISASEPRPASVWTARFIDATPKTFGEGWKIKFPEAPQSPVVHVAQATSTPVFIAIRRAAGRSHPKRIAR